MHGVELPSFFRFKSAIASFYCGVNALRGVIIIKTLFPQLLFAHDMIFKKFDTRLRPERESPPTDTNQGYLDVVITAMTPPPSHGLNHLP